MTAGTALYRVATTAALGATAKLTTVKIISPGEKVVKALKPGHIGRIMAAT
jgi:hypothetical protein